MDVKADPVDTRELIAWAQSFLEQCQRVLNVLNEIEMDVGNCLQSARQQTGEGDQDLSSGRAAPRVDLVPNSPATATLTAGLRRRERVHTTLQSQIELALQVNADLGATIPTAKPAQSDIRMAFSRRAKRVAALTAIDRLRLVRGWAVEQNIASYLAEATDRMGRTADDQFGYWADVTERPDWYAEQLGAARSSGSDLVIASSEVRRAVRLARELPAVSRASEATISLVRRHFDVVRSRMVRSTLEQMPLAKVKDVTGGRLRLGVLETHGFATIQHVLDSAASRLLAVPGVGQQTAEQVMAAAQQLARAVEDDLRFRIDLNPSDQATTQLVQSLYALDKLHQVRLAIGSDELDHIAADLRFLTFARPPAEGITIFLPRSGASLAETIRRRLELIDQRDVWRRLDTASRVMNQGAVAATVAWDDFAKRSADYYTLLGQIVELNLNAGAEAGSLPAEIVERVHGQALDDTFCRVSLRGYQSFGARFSLVQRRVIIGDEMGLGKTIQAIAVLAHLKSTADGGRLLVICPASVLINWTREVTERSTLRVHRLYGFDRDRALKSWLRFGDVAVTTFETLRSLNLTKISFALVVVDEAHMLKNPATQRAHNVRTLLTRAERALFLTGTPMENRITEFGTLVSYLQPTLMHSSNGDYISPDRFRQLVAPAYLRRNQQEVLAELPELVINDEWEEFSSGDFEAYRQAVAAGNFMAMRQAAFAYPEHSTKMARLIEIVTEAGANGRKVIVFSFFREVLARIANVLPHAHGPLTGSTTPIARQQLVDQFTNADHGAVLLSQIQAGGVGLNLQAGSVVVICEPQVKPSLEAQAIARAHRMGQVRGVQAHRLLTPDGVDERMVKILDSKQRIFDEYVRRSDVANASPQAVDISEWELAKIIIQREQERLAMENLKGIKGAQ